MPDSQVDDAETTPPWSAANRRWRAEPAKSSSPAKAAAARADGANGGRPCKHA